jgi:hypothetical protein
MLRKAMFLLAVLILLFVRTTPIPFSGIQSRVFADSCPSGNPAPIQGSLTANTHHTYPIQLQPCQTLLVTLNGSASSHPMGNANMTVKIRNSSHQDLFTSTFVCGVSCVVSLPTANAASGYPLPGTRGVEGLASEIDVAAGAFNVFAASSATFTLTLTIASRDNYNLGGTDLSNAPLIEFRTLQYGSVHNRECNGQVYKVHLAANQVIYVTGEATGSTTWSPNLSIGIYDASDQSLATLANLVVSGTKVFPAPNASPPVFRNTGSEQDFFLKVKSNSGPACSGYTTWDFRFQVETPKLVVTPLSATRGETATFELLGVQGASISGWKFATVDNGIVERTQNANSATWAGTVVDSGTGSVNVTIGGTAIPLEASIDVIPRTGWAWVARSPSRQSLPYVIAGVQNGVIDGPNPPDGTGNVGGASGWRITYASPAVTQINDNGPTHGFDYVASKLSDVGADGPTQFYWGVVGELEQITATFYRKQCGDYDPLLKPTGMISGASLLANTVRHESAAVQGHYGNYVNAQDDPLNNLGLFAESFIRGPSVTPQDYGLALVAGLGSRVSAISTAAGQEPYGINSDAAGTYLGGINFAPNYSYVCQ